MMKTFDLYERTERVMTCPDFGVVLHEYLMKYYDLYLQGRPEAVGRACLHTRMKIRLETPCENKKYPIILETFGLTHDMNLFCKKPVLGVSRMLELCNHLDISYNNKEMIEINDKIIKKILECGKRYDVSRSGFVGNPHGHYNTDSDNEDKEHEDTEHNEYENKDQDKYKNKDQERPNENTTNEPKEEKLNEKPNKNTKNEPKEEELKEEPNKNTKNEPKEEPEDIGMTELEILEKIVEMENLKKELEAEREKQLELDCLARYEATRQKINKEKQEEQKRRFNEMKTATYKKIYDDFYHLNVITNWKYIPDLFKADFVVLLFMDGNNKEGKRVRRSMFGDDDDFETYNLLIKEIKNEGIDNELCKEFRKFVDDIPIEQFHTKEDIMELLNDRNDPIFTKSSAEGSDCEDVPGNSSLFSGSFI